MTNAASVSNLHTPKLHAPTAPRSSERKPGVQAVAIVEGLADRELLELSRAQSSRID